MIEILVAAARFLVSKNFRDSIRELYRVSRAAPEWQTQLVEFKAKLKTRDRELAKALGHIVRQRATKLFSAELTSALMLGFYELVDNGFRHGCVSAYDSISIRVVLFGVGASVEVVNSRRKIPEHMETQGGLAQVHSLADQITITHDGRGIKMVIYDRHNRALEYKVRLAQQGITVINVGGFSGDVTDKIRNALFGESGDVIIVFGWEIHSSLGGRAAEELDQHEYVSRYAFVMDPQYLSFFPRVKDKMPKFVGCFASPEEAAAALRPRLDFCAANIGEEAAPRKRRSKKQAQ